MKPSVTLTVAGAILTLAACGGTSTPPRATPTPSATSSATATPRSSSSGSTATALELTAADIPGTTQVSDGELNNTPNTDGRVFANSDNTIRIEIDVIVENDEQSATSDYATVRDSAKSKVADVTNQSSPRFGQIADEFSGATSGGNNIFAITYREGHVLAAIFVARSNGTIAQTYAESVAGAEDQKIAANP